MVDWMNEFVRVRSLNALNLRLLKSYEPVYDSTKGADTLHICTSPIEKSGQCL